MELHKTHFKFLTKSGQTILFTCLPFITLAFQAGNSHAAGFDCSKAVNRMDKAICADAQTSTADEVMNSLYLKIKVTIDKERRKQLLVNQKLWLKQRNTKCQDLSSQCLKLAYSNRIGELLTKYEKSISLTPNELENIAKEFPFHSTWVGVYIVRNEDEADLEIPITVSLNNIVIGQTTPRTFFWYRLKPNEDMRYWFSSFAGTVSTMGLRVPLGNKYYFVQQITEKAEKNGQTILNSSFRSVKEDVGMKKALESKIIVAKNVGENIAPTSDPSVYNIERPPVLLQKLKEITSRFHGGEISQLQWSGEHKLLLEQSEAGIASR